MEQRRGKECPILVYPQKCTGCRICQIRCSNKYSGEFNTSKSYIMVIRDHGTRTSYLGFTDDCTWCGYCAPFCPYGALELKKLVRGGSV